MQHHDPDAPLIPGRARMCHLGDCHREEKGDVDKEKYEHTFCTADAFQEIMRRLRRRVSLNFRWRTDFRYLSPVFPDHHENPDVADWYRRCEYDVRDQVPVEDRTCVDRSDDVRVEVKGRLNIGVERVGSSCDGVDPNDYDQESHSSFR